MESTEKRNFENSGSTLLVALKLAPNSRELLTSIITKLTNPGDHVVGVHVLDCFSATVSREKFRSSTKQQLASTFQAVQGVYKGLCLVKQIDLNIKILTGCRLRKVLVEVAKEEKATKLILGSSEWHGIRSKNSLAKYCSKRLPETCSVLVLEHGNVVFEKNGMQSFPEKRALLPFGASLSMAYHSNILRHGFEPKFPSKTSSASENLLKKLWFSKHETAKQDAFDLQRRNNLREIHSCLHPANMPSSTQAVCLFSNSSAISLDHPGKNQFPLPCCKKIDGFLDDCDQLSPNHQNLAKRLQSISLDRTCKRFNYEELKKATSNFSTRNMVGKGGFSKVYQGTLPDGQQIAVKCLSQSPDAEEELLKEVDILTTFSHQHIVPLIGFCVDHQRQLLVYEFASNGNLDDYLHGEGETLVLEWAERFKIALGTAQALSYLHDGGPQSVIHRDVKSSNILLTSNLDPQVSDFGLAKLAPSSTASITCTDVFGTFGYIAPECFMFGKIDCKTDVYSFGVVLLEIITGKPAVDNSKPKSSENLVLWARPLLEARKLDELVDPRLKGQFNVKQMNQVLLAASLCICQSPESRPHMNLVVKLLCGEEDALVSEVDADDTDNYIFDPNGSIKDSSDDYSIASESSEVRKHLSLGMLGVDEDSVSECSMETSIDLLQSNENITEYSNDCYSPSSSLDSL